MEKVFKRENKRLRAKIRALENEINVTKLARGLPEIPAEELKKAVVWMLETAKALRYKAPEQLDVHKILSSMFATANFALANPEGLKEDV